MTKDKELDDGLAPRVRRQDRWTPWSAAIPSPLSNRAERTNQGRRRAKPRRRRRTSATPRTKVGQPPGALRVERAAFLPLRWDEKRHRKCRTPKVAMPVAFGHNRALETHRAMHLDGYA